jgi:putative hydrolase of the HAD superfamily
MTVAPKALSLDLDDTLWPIWPVMQRAEAALDAFLRERCPRTADKYPIALMRQLRERIAPAIRPRFHPATQAVAGPCHAQLG